MVMMREKKIRYFFLLLALARCLFDGQSNGCERQRERERDFFFFVFFRSGEAGLTFASFDFHFSSFFFPPLLSSSSSKHTVEKGNLHIVSLKHHLLVCSLSREACIGGREQRAMRLLSTVSRSFSSLSILFSIPLIHLSL